MELENGFSPLPDFFKIYNSRQMSQRLSFGSGFGLVLRVLFSDYRKYYPTPLPQSAVLRKAEGTFWIVKWKITQEEIITFEDGWNKFVTENRVIDGDYLLFTYDGSRSFWVRIFRNGLTVKSEAPIKVEQISDDEDEKARTKEEDSHENMVFSLSLGSEDKDGDDDDADDADYDDANDDDDEDDTTFCEYDEAPESSHRGLSTRPSFADPELYLDNIDNPFFITTSSSRKMVVPQKVIRDYVLNFGRKVKLIDRFGKVERIVGKFSDRVVVNKWDEIYKRNKAKAGDLIICEIVRRKKDVVRSIKAHFIKK